MIPGGNQPPYRAPCDGAVICGNGSRYRHGQASAKEIPVYLYDTQVCNWSWDGCPDVCGGGDSPCTAYTDCADGLIDPYERFAFATPDAPCSAPCQSGDDCEDPPCQPCGPWCYSATNPGPAPSFYQPQMLTSVAIVDAGENYVVGDLLSGAGGTASNFIAPPGADPSNTAVIAVMKVGEMGNILAAKITNAGSYQSNPSSPNSVLFGTGTGATFDLTFGGQTENLSVCFKYGYKNVQAGRYWHGIPGYFFNYDPAIISCTSGGDIVDWEYYQDTASQSKYLSASFEITQTQVGTAEVEGSPVDIDYSATTSWVVSVDPTTGIITVDSMSLWDPCSSYNGESGDDCAILTDWSINSNDYIGLAQGLNVGDLIGVMLDNGGSATAGSGSASGSYAYGPDDYYFAGEFTASDSSIYYTYSCTGVGCIGSEDFNGTLTTTITVALSGSNTSSDIQEDINTLLDQWPLNDDALYPWRADSATSFAPLVTRNEVPGNVNPIGFGPNTNGDPVDDCCGNAPDSPDWTPTYDQIPVVDPNYGLYDGSIVGAPLPAGYQGYFDFSYVDYEWCTDGDPPYGYIYGYGQRNVGQQGIPLNATQWSPNTFAWQFPGGAWIFYNHNPSWVGCDNDYNFQPPVMCVAQKWAETKMGFPSQNFFRPAADDRFAYDEGQVYNISNISGSGPGAQVTLQTTTECSAPTLGSTSGVWGGSAVGGFYEIASVSGAVATLGSLVYNVPSDWASASQDEMSCFGKLRWSMGDTATDPWAILGRAGISSAAEYDSMADVTELTTDSLPTLGLGATSADHVDIYDTNMNLITANLAVTRIDDSHFTVPVAFGTLSGAAWMMSHGAPAYSWDDAYPKGDYVYTDWTWWPRQVCQAADINAAIAACADSDSGSCDCSPLGSDVTPPCYAFSAFTQTAGCVPFNPCSPAVLCISPNGEDFPNGHTFGFAEIDFDEQYGSGWQATIQQVMEDLLYQTPHYPAQGADCSPTPFAWSEDNGICATPDFSNWMGEDTVWYPARPYVEARLTAPDGALGLPAGITIGWYSPVDVTDCESPPANVLFPPGPNGVGITAFTIWFLWNNLCGCATGGGDFQDLYENQVAGCVT